MRNICEFTKVLLATWLMLAISQTATAEEMTEVLSHDAHHNQNNLEWPGIYKGFLPCEGCYGIKTSLALNTNNSYILITQYTGKSPRDFVEKGTFTWGDKNNVIVLTPRKGSSAQQYYVGENKLILLDKNGNFFSGKNADRYVLRRNEMKEPTESHSSH